MRFASAVLTWFVLLFVGVAGCGDNLKLVSDASITSFSIDGVAGDITGHQISVKLPAGTDVTSLTPTITFVGQSLSPQSGVPQDFTSPVSYTVTAEDGSTVEYIATVTLGQSAEKALTFFVFETADNPGLTSDIVATINGTTVTAMVPFGTNVTALVASFSTTGDHVVVGNAQQASGVTANNFTNPVTYTVVAADGSTQAYTVTVFVAQSDAKAITLFNFEAAHNSAELTDDVTGDITGNAISLTVPYDTDVTALVATFTTTGASVKVGPDVQTSGTTPNDFTNPVTYTVTAADNTTQDYVVTVSIAPNTAKDITSFTFTTLDNPGLAADVTATITGNQITATMPFGTSLVGLKASFETTGVSVNIGGAVQDSGVTANDFSTTLTYTVVAADLSTQDYFVTLTVGANSAKNITAFSILGIDGIITGTNIDLTVPFGTPLTALVPTITITGVSVSPGSGVPNNFMTPATYTVTAADNTTKNYTVTVTVAPNTAKDITRFTINGLDAVIATTSPTTGTITLNVPSGTPLTNLTPVVTITGVSVSPASGVAQDFSDDVEYVVTAADGSMKTYTVSIGIVNGNGTKLISSFTILGVAGSITNGAQSSTVTVILPLGTDRSALTPTIVINASSISPPSRVPQDFTQPVTYTVTAADLSTRVYTVTVTLQ